MDSPKARTPAKQKPKKEGGDEFKMFGSQAVDCIVWGSPHDSETCKLVYVPDTASSYHRSPDAASVIKKPPRRMLALQSEEPEYMLELAALAERVKMNAEKMKARKAALERNSPVAETGKTKDDAEDSSNLSTQNDSTNTQEMKNDTKFLSVPKLDSCEISNKSLSDIFNDDDDDFLLKCTSEIDELCSASRSTSEINESNMLGHAVKNLQQTLPEKNGFVNRRTSPRIKSRFVQAIRTGTEESKTKLPKTEHKLYVQSNSSMRSASFTDEYRVESRLHSPAAETKSMNFRSISSVTNTRQILPDKNTFAIRRTSPRKKCRFLQQRKNDSKALHGSPERKDFVTRRTSPRTKFRSLQNIKSGIDELCDSPETKVPKLENTFSKQSSSVPSSVITNKHVVGSRLHREETQVNNRNSATKLEAADESLEAVLQSFVDEDIELLSQAYPECAFSSVHVSEAQRSSKITFGVNLESATVRSCTISAEYHADLSIGRLRPNDSNISKSCSSLDKVFVETPVIQTRQSVQKTSSSVNSESENSMDSSVSHSMTASQYARCTAEQIERKRREAKLRLEKKRLKLQQTIQSSDNA